MARAEVRFLTTDRGSYWPSILVCLVAAVGSAALVGALSTTAARPQVVNTLPATTSPSVAAPQPPGDAGPAKQATNVPSKSAQTAARPATTTTTAAPSSPVVAPVSEPDVDDETPSTSGPPDDSPKDNHAGGNGKGDGEGSGKGGPRPGQGN